MEISKLIISVCVEVIAYAVFAYAFYDDRVGFAARFEREVRGAQDRSATHNSANYRVQVYRDSLAPTSTLNPAPRPRFRKFSKRKF